MNIPTAAIDIINPIIDESKIAIHEIANEKIRKKYSVCPQR
jgi:hypothetical protein